MRHRFSPLQSLLIPASGGTKPHLAERLTQELQTPLLRPLPNNTPHRILSIDMGIRNLALCLLSIPPSQPPQISDWNRVTVSQKPDSSTIESFEPLEYAQKAYSLMHSALQSYRPHTILIERQRYRSAGGAAIQEWTVRVNMLESMFHATLHTLAQTCGHDIVVRSVSPRRITGFWLADVDEKMNVRETKMAKVACAERIVRGEESLDEGGMVEFVGEARMVAEGFNRGKRGDRSKFDDLADSMLQGLGWWKWHVNRARMVDEILNREKEKVEMTEPVKVKGRRRLKVGVSPEDSIEEEIEKTVKRSRSVAKKGRERKKLEIHA